MKLTFIGTGSGKTSLKRNHSSILLTQNNHNLLIDCGDGITKALLQNNIDYNSIDSILFSHYHADHFTGISALITQMKLNSRNKKLILFTHHELQAQLENILKYTYLFKDVLGFELEISPFNCDENISVDNNLNFMAKRNSHVVNKHRIKEYEESNFVSSSFLISSEVHKIVYTSDIGSDEDLFLFEIESPELFISETTHIELDSLSRVIKKLKPRKIMLTHISDEDENQIESWLAENQHRTGSDISMAEDGQIVTLYS